MVFLGVLVFELVLRKIMFGKHHAPEFFCRGGHFSAKHEAEGRDDVRSAGHGTARLPRGWKRGDPMFRVGSLSSCTTKKMNMKRLEEEEGDLTIHS